MLVNDSEVDMVGEKQKRQLEKKFHNMAPEQKLFPEFNLDVLGKKIKANVFSWFVIQKN